MQLLATMLPSRRLQRCSPNQTASFPRMAPLKAVFNLKSVHRDAPQGAPRRPIRSHACSSARSAVPSAYVCLLEPTETKSPVLVTITGRPRGVDPNAPEQLITFSKIVSCYLNLQLVCAHVKW